MADYFHNGDAYVSVPLIEDSQANGLLLLFLQSLICLKVNMLLDPDSCGCITPATDSFCSVGDEG